MAFTVVGKPSQPMDGAAHKDPSVTAAMVCWKNLYHLRPQHHVTMLDLEEYVAERMELLAAIDALLQQSRTSGRSVAEDVVNHVRSVSNRNTARSIHKSAEADELSHYACRMAFCKDEHWRSWFIRTEEHLLMARVELNNKCYMSVLKENGIKCVPLSQTDPKVAKAANWMSYKAVPGQPAKTADTTFFTVPMLRVLKLVRDRKVICVGGQAIVPERDMVQVLAGEYRTRLAKGLNEALRARQHNSNAEFDRISAMLDTFMQNFVSNAPDTIPDAQEGAIGIADIEQMAKLHMPLCMQEMEKGIRTTGHLKHSGRWQLGLFLKRIGLSMDDAITYFSTQMTVKGGGTREAFNKSRYGYNIRHQYGKEGKRTSYSSLTCSSMITGAAPTGGCAQSCPFRFYSEADLKTLMSRPHADPMKPAGPAVRLPTADIEDIIKDSSSHHYTRACWKYFQGLHSKKREYEEFVARDTLFQSPYEYYAISLNARLQMEGKAHPTGAKEEGTGFRKYEATVKRERDVSTPATEVSQFSPVKDMPDVDEMDKPVAAAVGTTVPTELQP